MSDLDDELSYSPEIKDFSAWIALSSSPLSHPRLLKRQTPPVVADAGECLRRH